MGENGGVSVCGIDGGGNRDSGGDDEGNGGCDGGGSKGGENVQLLWVPLVWAPLVQLVVRRTPRWRRPASSSFVAMQGASLNLASHGRSLPQANPIAQ